ncbi:MAG: N-acetylmannosamine-6-phosphate 2-epimerase [Schwartzia sp.]|nr:N-acetylmannosamine-6-phosphate 2-epimerase [Schwartzia sp. (in: firmicutes)]
MLDEVRGKLIVSCQALPGEPLFGAEMMARMALAAKEGGAAAIRAQGVADIRAVREATGLPVIGLIKRQYEDSDIYITPTMNEVNELLTSPCEMIALDMTARKRPHDEAASALLARIHEAGRLVLADISTYEEGIAAERLGADAVSTTLSGYTPYSPKLDGPDLTLIGQLAAALRVPLFAEGRIRSPEDLRRVMPLGPWAAVVGTAITRPQLITRSFAEALPVEPRASAGASF